MATWTPRTTMRGGVPWGAAFNKEDPTGLPWGRRVRSMASSYVSSTVPSSPPSIISSISEKDTPKDNTIVAPRLGPLLESQLSGNGALTVVERLNQLLDTGQFADVNVRVGKGTDQTVFKAHRLLLSTASQALYKLVYAVNPNPGPSEITTVRITDVDPKSFERVLKYIYTDDVSIESINDAFSLLKASKKWGLKDMEIKTLNVIKNFLDGFAPTTEEQKNELCELLPLLESQKNGILDKCLQVLVKFANEIIPCQGFLNLDEHFIRKLISHPNFRYNNMLQLFESIRDWGMNQILKRNLRPNQLQPLVSELITLINLSGIDDSDFIKTVLPSDCLGKGDIIAFFMNRGLEIPRDLTFNNNQQTNLTSTNGASQEYSKVCRYKKGYKIPDYEIYLEHEVRFRANKNLLLFGVVFGFLFSDTDMGVTVHCQGPWETVQWTDIVQSYCRVSWEKMTTADVRLLFSEPTQIYANHSYKILVKIGRMSSGSSEVDMWGGDNGQGSVSTSNADFYFLKAAVDPTKEVEESETDAKPGLITDLLYKIDEDQESTVQPRRVRQRPKPAEEPEETTTDATRRCRANSPQYTYRRPSTISVDDNKPFLSSNPRRQSILTSPVESHKPDYSTSTRFRPSQESMVSNTRRDSAFNDNEISTYYLRPPSKTYTESSASLSFRTRDSIGSSTRPSGAASNLGSSSFRDTTRTRFGDSSSSTRREPSTSSSLSRHGQSSSSFSDSRYSRAGSSSRAGDYTPSIYRRDSTRSSGTSSFSSRFLPTSSNTTSSGSSYSGYSSNIGSRFGSSYSRR